MKLFTGIDLSLSSSAIITLTDKSEIITECIIKTTAATDIEPRLISIRDNIKEILSKEKIEIIYLEGLSFGSHGKIAELGALHYLIRILLYKYINFKVIPPTTLKKFVIKGNAKKELMLKEVFKQWGYDTDSNDLCDAYALAKMAIHEFKIVK